MGAQQPPEQEPSASVEERKLELEGRRVRADEQRIHIERARNRLFALGGLGTLVTVLIAVATFLSSLDAQRDARFEETVRWLTSEEEGVDPARRMAAAHALVRYYSAKHALTPWKYAYRGEIVNLLGALFKRRVARYLDSSATEPREETILYEALARTVVEIGEQNHMAFEGVDFMRTDLRDLDLTGAHLAGVNLTEAHLERTGLREADLEGAASQSAHFEGADLERAHFEGAHLGAAHFEGAHLWVAHFEGANLFAVHFEGANLSSAHFQGASLIGAQFEGANLSSAHFQGADLYFADFAGADLGRAQFEGAKRIEAASFDQETRLPNGEHWTPDTDMTQFTEPKGKS